MDSTSRPTPHLEERDLVDEAFERAKEAIAALLLALASAPRRPEFVPAGKTGVARPQLRRWELAGKIRVLKAGREKLYSMRDIAGLAERATDASSASSTAESGVSLVAIAANARRGGRR